MYVQQWVHSPYQRVREKAYTVLCLPLISNSIISYTIFFYTNIKTSKVNGVASTKQCNVTCLNIVFEDSAGTLLSHKQTPTSSLFSVINIVFAYNNQTLWQYLLFSQKQSCLASTRRCRDNVGLETPCWGKTPRFAKNLELESSYQKASRISQGGGNSNFPFYVPTCCLSSQCSSKKYINGSPQHCGL